MPRFAIISNNRQRSKRPIMRRGSPLGTLRSPKYRELRRIIEAKRIARKAAKQQKRLDRKTKQANSWRHWKKMHATQREISMLRTILRRLNPPPRQGPPKPQPKPLLVNQLVKKQGIGKEWIPIINRMAAEGVLAIRPETNLRKAIEKIMRRFNPGAANAFAAGKRLYLPRNTKSLTVPLALILRNARSKITAPTLEQQQEKEKKEKNH